MTYKQQSQIFSFPGIQLSSDIISQPNNYFNTLSPAKKKVLDVFIRLCNTYPNVYVSQSTIGKEVGITRESVNRIVKELESLGFINKSYRHMTSCKYKLNSYFNDMTVRRLLSDIFPSLKSLPLALLFICQSEIITGVNLNLIFNSSSNSYISNPLSISHYIPRRGRGFGFREMGETPENIKNELVMQENPISPVIRSITELKLTKWGQIKLTRFPDEAIKFAQEQCKVKDPAKVTDAFAWFYVVCSNYCNERSIHPDHGSSNALMKRFKAPSDAKMVLENKVFGRTEKPQFKKSNDPDVPSSVERMKAQQAAELAKPKVERAKRILEIREQLEKAQINLNKLEGTFMPEMGKLFIELEMKRLISELETLDAELIIYPTLISS